MIIDSVSCANVVLEEMVTKLGLKTKKHPNPYNFHWRQDGGGMKITHHCLVSFSIGKIYCDELLCDMMKMSACHLLLGRPWMFNRRVQHDGYHNTYSFTKDGYKVVLKPMHPGEFAKRLKLERAELMIRSGAIDHLGKRRPVLFVKAKERPMEKNDDFVVE